MQQRIPAENINDQVLAWIEDLPLEKLNHYLEQLPPDFKFNREMIFKPVVINEIETIFFNAAIHAPEVFDTVIEQTASDILDEAIIYIESLYAMNALHHMLLENDEFRLKLLLNKVSLPAFIISSDSKDKIGLNPLQQALYCKNPAMIETFIEKADSDTVDNWIKKPGFLYYIFKKYNDDLLARIIKKASAAALNQSLSSIADNSVTENHAGKLAVEEPGMAATSETPSEDTEDLSSGMINIAFLDGDFGETPWLEIILDAMEPSNPHAVTAETLQALFKKLTIKTLDASLFLDDSTKEMTLLLKLCRKQIPIFTPSSLSSTSDPASLTLLNSLPDILIVKLFQKLRALNDPDAPEISLLETAALYNPAFYNALELRLKKLTGIESVYSRVSKNPILLKRIDEKLIRELMVLYPELREILPDALQEEGGFISRILNFFNQINLYSRYQTIGTEIDNEIAYLAKIDSSLDDSLDPNIRKIILDYCTNDPKIAQQYHMQSRQPTDEKPPELKKPSLYSLFSYFFYGDKIQNKTAAIAEPDVSLKPTMH